MVDFPSQYTESWLYKKGNITVRVDELDYEPFGNDSYKQVLENAARKLGLISNKQK